MFASDLVLDTQNGTDVTFKLVKQDGTGSSRINVLTNLIAPALLSIKHSTSGKGSGIIDRHLLQFQETVVDAAGLPVVWACNFTLQIPRNPIITTQKVHDGVFHVMDLLSDGSLTSLVAMNNLDALLRGES